MFQASFETISGEASKNPLMSPPKNPLMSPPLEKCSPVARSTMTRTRTSSFSASKTRRSWSRCGMETMLNGGRSRMTSARSRKGSVSTRKPSSEARRGSEKVGVMFGPALAREFCHRFGHAVAECLGAKRAAEIGGAPLGDRDHRVERHVDDGGCTQQALVAATL